MPALYHVQLFGKLVIYVCLSLDAISLALLNTHLEGPVIIIEEVQSHLWPVNWNNLTSSRVTNGGDLEWEEVLACVLSLELLTVEESSSAWVNLECVVVWQEFAVESSNDHDLIFAELAHTSSLSGSDWYRWVHIHWVVIHVDFFPSSCGDGAHVELEPLNWVGVLLTRVLDTTENVDIVVLKVGTWVIMTTFINWLKFKPVVLVRIVQFDLLRCWTHFFSGTRYHDVCICNVAARVSVSGVLHTGLVLEVHLVLWLVEGTDELSTLEHAVGQCLVITTSDHVHFWVLLTQLNHLEIVREVASEVYGSMTELLWDHVQDGNGLWVLLEDEKLLWKLASFCDLHDLSHVIKLLSNSCSFVLHNGCMINLFESFVFTSFFLNFDRFLACLNVL